MAMMTIIIMMTIVRRWWLTTSRGCGALGRVNRALSQYRRVESIISGRPYNTRTIQIQYNTSKIKIQYNSSTIKIPFRYNTNMLKSNTKIMHRTLFSV